MLITAPASSVPPFEASCLLIAAELGWSFMTTLLPISSAVISAGFSVSLYITFPSITMKYIVSAT